MNTIVVTAVLIVASLAQPQSHQPTPGLLDRAGMFSAAAVKGTQWVLERIMQRTRVPVVIETIEAIPGLEQDASAELKRKAFDELAERRVKEIKDEGVYLLISKNDHSLKVHVGERFGSLLPASQRQEVHDALIGEFKKGRFDDGLVRATQILDKSLASAVVLASPQAVPVTLTTNPKPDQRLITILNAAKLKYDVLPNGDCEVGFSLPHGRHQVVIVQSHTEWFGGLERRRIISAANQDATKLSKDILIKLMTDTNMQKVGCWAAIDVENRKILAWVAKLPADMKPADLLQVISIAATYTDGIETSITNTDKF